ncbi:hypothetical protein ACFY00_35800 [Kitasatospora sp. NPDC001540]|uniref:hypothetical protein n=1 Tax=Kitasatospora sp. NPDC001540 TaxID=3364014 RepID=UPI00367C71F1
MDVYGSGTIDDHLVIAGMVDAGPPEVTVDALTAVARSLHEENSEWPYRVWPDTGGLICWGATVSADVLYWDTTDPDPDRWTVVVRNREGDFARFDTGMAEFVLRLLGPAGERPLESPCLYGLPNSRFLNGVDRRRIEAVGGYPWEYLEELYEANEAAEEED